MTWKRWVQHVDYFFHFYGLRIRKLKGGILRIEHRYISIEKYPMFGLACMFLLVDLVYFWNFLKNPQTVNWLIEVPILCGLVFWVYIQFAFFGTTVLTLGTHSLMSRQTLTPGVTKISIAAIQKLLVSQRHYRTRYASGWIYFIWLVYTRPHRKDGKHLLMSFVDHYDDVELALGALQENLQVPVEYPEEKSKKRLKA